MIRARNKLGHFKKEPNPIFLLDNCALVIMTNGLCLISPQDVNLIKKFRWYLSKSKGGQNYVFAIKNGKRVSMHRVLLRPQRGYVVDHIDHDTLDNRRGNLRLALPKENCRNSLPRGGVSKYKGVTYCAKKKLYRARIGVDRKRIGLGRFKSEVDAALAYDKAAKFYFKEFAKLNSEMFEGL